MKRLFALVALSACGSVSVTSGDDAPIAQAALDHLPNPHTNSVKFYVHQTAQSPAAYTAEMVAIDLDSGAEVGTYQSAPCVQNGGLADRNFYNCPSANAQTADKDRFTFHMGITFADGVVSGGADISSDQPTVDSANQMNCVPVQDAARADVIVSCAYNLVQAPPQDTPITEPNGPHAHDWHSVADCGNLVVDQNGQSSDLYQVVIKDAHIVGTVLGALGGKLPAIVRVFDNNSKIVVSNVFAGRDPWNGALNSYRVIEQDFSLFVQILWDDHGHAIGQKLTVTPRDVNKAVVHTFDHCH